MQLRLGLGVCLVSLRSNTSRLLSATIVGVLTDAAALFATTGLHMASVDAEVHVPHLRRLAQQTGVRVDDLHDICIVPGQPEGPRTVPVDQRPRRVQP